MNQTITKGDIFWVDFDPSKATETQKTRPAIVCSHDVLNKNFTRVIVAPITSNLKRVFSFEFKITSKDFVKGKVMLDQLRSVDKSRLGKKIGSLSFKEMNEVDQIIKYILGII